MITKSILVLMSTFLLLAEAAPAQQSSGASVSYCPSTSDSPNIMLKVGTDSRSYAVPLDFSGLSFGTISMQPDNNVYIFDQSSTQIRTLFQQMGIRNLRIGGSSVDENGSSYTPSTKDIDALFGFAQAADLKVIYSLTLLNNQPSQNALNNMGAGQDATTASYITQNYSRWLANFAIGNEPNDYHGDGGISNFSEYLGDWGAFATTILGLDPTAKFGGPDGGSGGSGNSWGVQFAQNVLTATPIQFHYYVGKSDKGLKKQTIIDDMLSPTWVSTKYPDEYKATGEPVLALPQVSPLFVPAYRFTEADAFYTNGTKGVRGGDNSFASALFSLDFMHYWAEQNLSGVNFHTTEWKFNGTISQEKTDSGVNYGVYPIGYGIKAFDLGGHGYLQTVTPKDIASGNVTAYAVGDGLDTYVTIINKTHMSGSSSDDIDAVVKIKPNGIEAASAAAMVLAGDMPGDGGSLAATLGGAFIPNNGQWQGQWCSLAPESDGSVMVTVPATTAAVVRIHAASNFAGPIQLNQDGTLEIFGTNTSNGQDVWENGQNEADVPTSSMSAWNGWTDLASGVLFNGAAAVAKNLDNTLELFVPSMSGDVYSNQQSVPDGSWSGWTDMGSTSMGMTHLQVTNQADGSLALFGIGPNRDVWFSSQSAPRSGWSSWTDLSGQQILAGFVAGQNLNGSVELFGADLAGHVWTNTQAPGGAWSGWSSMPGATLAPQLAIARNVDGRMEIFGVDRSSGNVWYNSQISVAGTWAGWRKISGQVIAPGFVVGQGSDGRLVIFGVAAPSSPLGGGLPPSIANVWSISQDTPSGNFFGKWNNLGGSLIDPQLVIGNTADGRIQLFGIGQNHDVWSDWQIGDGGDWAGWSDFGGNRIEFYPQEQQTQPTQSASFTLSISPANDTLSLTANATCTIAIVPQNGFSGSVSLSATGLPLGAIASFSPDPTTSTTSTLTLEEGSTVPPGTYTVTITGTSGSLTSSTTITLTVVP